MNKILLSNEQNELLNICKHQITAIILINNCNKMKHTHVKRIIVQGKAGSEKVKKVLCKLFANLSKL